MRLATATLALISALSVGASSNAFAQSGQSPGNSGSTGLSPTGDMEAAGKQKGGSGSMKKGGSTSDGMKGGNMSNGASNGSPASGGMTK